MLFPSFNFDNSGQTALGARALYSETSRTFAPAVDWSGQTLGLWSRGRSQNAAETLSVVITDAGNNSVVIENTAEQNAVQSTIWTEWAISLSDIEGIDLGQVKTLAIRIGDPAAQQAGSKGKIYIDDIAIYPQQSVSPITITINVPNGDFEQIYKPGSDSITADLGAGWTQGLGPDAPLDDGIATYSDGTTGDAVVDLRRTPAHVISSRFQARGRLRDMFDAVVDWLPRTRYVRDLMDGDVSEQEAKAKAAAFAYRLAEEEANDRVDDLESIRVYPTTYDGELLHVPVWFMQYSHKGKPMFILIDGHSGEVMNGERPLFSLW